MTLFVFCNIAHTSPSHVSETAVILRQAAPDGSQQTDVDFQSLIGQAPEEPGAIHMAWTLKDVQEWLGHSDIKMTANIYSHLDTARKSSIAASLAEKFGA